MNGASDLLVAVLGERGRHARFVVGCSNLPYDLAVEIEAMFEIDDIRSRPGAATIAVATLQSWRMPAIFLPRVTITLKPAATVVDGMIAAAPASGRGDIPGVGSPELQRGAFYAVIRGGRDRRRLCSDYRQR